MNEPAQLDLIELFRAFLAHYPTMRFGQAVCAVAGWENEDPALASDEALVAALNENLRRFEDRACEVACSSMSNDLATALSEVRRRQPAVPLGKLLARFASKNCWNIYDLENDELLAALKAEFATEIKESVTV